ncbi:HAD-IIB family hydrolase [Paenibacillus sp. MSJ-34]|uniref:HAD-IIB family hydrolase n=1 Tax=Paenibacillus sp. MSJ-34 TaxID=2841529 RepID=UPI001C11869D|nr:HAD-IIB family hydrolase [Paenibacillus sp. MSJ-34]MBU5441359.1 HAD-IIB family hydrolase [Paenibacillus sp. MSJ-34]
MYFIFDLDGTICYKGLPVSPQLTNVLLRLESLGHRIGFASARHCRDMLPVLDDRLHGKLLIGAGGAMTRFRGETVRIEAFPQPVAESVLALLRDCRATALIDGDWNYACLGDSGHPFIQQIDPLGLADKTEIERLERIVKILVLDCDDVPTLHAKLETAGVSIHSHAGEKVVDMTCRGVNKMTALEHFGIQEGEFVCFGNDMNDIPMFEKARHSVAIGDHAELNAIAKERIPLDGHVEERIIAKLEELAKAGTSV